MWGRVRITQENDNVLHETCIVNIKYKTDNWGEVGGEAETRESAMQGWEGDADDNLVQVEQQLSIFVSVAERLRFYLHFPVFVCVDICLNLSGKYNIVHTRTHSWHSK